MFRPTRLTPFVLAAFAVHAQYKASNNAGVVNLEDQRAQISVSIASNIGNIVYDMTVKGQKVLRFPYASLDEFKARPGLNGIPFLAPWANRLDEQAFYANGKRYAFDMTLGNVRGDRPIHGFVQYTPHWQVIEAKADRRSAWVTSRLDFYRQPEWMAQFPFAHTIEITHRLRDGALEVQTSVQNLSNDPMPISIGYHPYFQLTDSPRAEWTISVAAKKHYPLTSDKIPTGDTEPIEKFFPNPADVAIKDINLDHVFGDLTRDSQARATMTLRGRQQRLDVVFGPKYPVAVIYSPSTGRDGAPPQNFLCFEPMAGITNAMNAAHKGVYKDLQTLAPNATWQESFWVRPSGF